MGRLVCDVSNFASFSCEVPIQKFAFLTSSSLRKWCSYTLLKLSRAGLLRKVALPSRAIPYSFDTQVTLILILIDVQYSQNAVFTFGKDLNHQNHSSSGSPKSLLLRLSPPGRKIPPPAKFLIPPTNVGEFTSIPTPYRYLENPVMPIQLQNGDSYK